MSVQNLEINKANLLNVVVSLPKNEFEQFVSDARKLKRREESLLDNPKKLAVRKQSMA